MTGHPGARLTSPRIRCVSAAAAALLLAVAAGCSSGEQADVSIGAPNATETTLVAPTTTIQTAPTTGSPQSPVTTARRTPRTTQAPYEEPGTTQPPTPPPKQARRIAYPAGGPSGPVVPPSDPAYEFFTAGQCSELLAATTRWARPSPIGDVPKHQLYLYRAAANTCLSNWDTAVLDFDRLAPLRGDFSAAVTAGGNGGCPSDPDKANACPRCDQVVLDWLTEVMTAYKSDPELPPVLTGTTGSSPC